MNYINKLEMDNKLYLQEIEELKNKLKNPEQEIRHEQYTYWRNEYEKSTKTMKRDLKYNREKNKELKEQNKKIETTNEWLKKNIEDINNDWIKDHNKQYTEIETLKAQIQEMQQQQ